MEQNTLTKLIKVVAALLIKREERFTQLADKMNKDYDWFFRHGAIEQFILNLEIKHLKELLDEIKGSSIQYIEEIVDVNYNYHLQKLVCESIDTNEGLVMCNLAHIHERNVHQKMYNILGRLKAIIDNDR